jgi:predicted alpha/beta-hydrolase family hydrolase
VTIRIACGDADVTAEWDGTPDDARAVLVLAHGAGGDLNDPVLQDVGSALSSSGIAVLRFNFPYREAGRRAPGSQAVSEACYRDVASFARRDGVPMFCGGKSYGGRMASHIAADGTEMTGLVLISYPLHPPGRPEKIREAHLRDVGVPMLFVQGTSDPFAAPDLLSRTVGSLPDASLVSVEGGDHSLRVRGRKRSEVVDDVVASIESFVTGVLKRR